MNGFIRCVFYGGPIDGHEIHVAGELLYGMAPDGRLLKEYDTDRLVYHYLADRPLGDIEGDTLRLQLVRISRPCAQPPIT